MTLRGLDPCCRTVSGTGPSKNARLHSSTTLFSASAPDACRFSEVYSSCLIRSLAALMNAFDTRVGARFSP